MRIRGKMLVSNETKGCDLIGDGDWGGSKVDTRN